MEVDYVIVGAGSAGCVLAHPKPPWQDGSSSPAQTAFSSASSPARRNGRWDRGRRLPSGKLALYDVAVPLSDLLSRVAHSFRGLPFFRKHVHETFSLCSVAKIEDPRGWSYFVLNWGHQHRSIILGAPAPCASKLEVPIPNVNRIERHFDIFFFVSIVFIRNYMKRHEPLLECRAAAERPEPPEMAT